MPEERIKKINVPTNYRVASKILRQVIEENKNVKTLVLENTHLRPGKGFAMMNLILNNLKQIDEIIGKTGILKKESKLNPWLCKVLIGELIFGRGELSGECLPVKCVLTYRDALKEALGNSELEPAKQIDLKVPRYVRINTNALTNAGAHKLLLDEGWILVEETFDKYDKFLERVKSLDNSEYLVDFHFKDVLVFSGTAKNYWARNAELKSKFVLQNKACVLPTFLLNPPKKSVVLDMCAAPGLKTTHLANLMKNKGRIYAVERDPNRYKLLCDYSSEFGVIKTMNEDCLKLTDEQVPGVEYILLDPSCSGSGMIERLQNAEVIDKMRLFRLGGLQYKLLYHAMTAFPNVKKIVYSTCSIYPEENEAIVQGALKHCGHFKLMNAQELLEMEWKNLGSSEYKGIGEKCLYARTESDLTVGMFVAVFERCAEDEQNEFYLQNEKQKESYDNLNRVTKKEFSRNRKKIKENQRAMSNTNEEVPINSINTNEEVPIQAEEEPAIKKKKKKHSKSESEEVAVEAEEQLEPAPIIEDMDVDVKPKKKKKKSKDSKLEEEATTAIDQLELNQISAEDNEPQKKKKKKKKEIN